MNSFTKSLQYEVKPFSLIERLNLSSFSDNVEVFISDDKKYINLKLKDSETSLKHLVFQIPIQENKLSYLKNHPQYEYLNNRYELYELEYLDKIKNQISNEKKFLNELFPDMVTHTRIRIKSKPSYKKKLNDRIKDNKNFLIDDIIAQRIVIYEVNGSDNTQVLKQASYDVAKYLEEYRKKTDFAIKPVHVIGSEGISHLPYISKDYILNPKSSGYESLHIVSEDTTNKDCTFETQIRTCYIEDKLESNSAISHRNYKHRYFDDTSVLRVPRYIEVTNFKDSHSNYILYDVPLNYRFHHYYGKSFEYYRNELNMLQKYVKLNSIKDQLYNSDIHSVIER